MRVISFSLYGDRPIYVNGAIENAALAPLLYPGWTCRFYIGDSVPRSICERLRDLNSEIVEMRGCKEDETSAMWRFRAFFDEGIEYVISRDCDSRLSLREVKAVEEWIRSDKDFHIMRDHPDHDFPILAGMWGAKGGKLRSKIDRFIEGYENHDKRFIDQEYLSIYVYPYTLNRATIHDSFFKFERVAEPFPSSRVGGEFIGEVFDSNNYPLRCSRRRLLKFENSVFRRKILALLKFISFRVRMFRA